MTMDCSSAEQVWPRIEWEEAGQLQSAEWHSASGYPPPRRIVVVDDRLSADRAYPLACSGTALLWRGDYHNARQLLGALARRCARQGLKPVAGIGEFDRLRMARAQHARILGQLLIPFQADHVIPLRRAPDVRWACQHVDGPAKQPYLRSLRELLGLIGAYEWRSKGIPLAAVGGRIHPHYGVFAPVRHEYVDLVVQAPLPPALASCPLAFDIGTGTGVLAAVLARRGVGHIVATDQEPRALACATENLARLGLDHRVEVVAADLFPPGRAALAVCNPPWLPAKPSSPLERAVYDPGSRMLRGFLAGLAAHLVPGGEGWLIMSDLAEHLGLRRRDDLLALFAAAGLQVLGRLDTRPRHRRAREADDALSDARAAEVISLWRLVPVADR